MGLEFALFYSPMDTRIHPKGWSKFLSDTSLLQNLQCQH